MGGGDGRGVGPGTRSNMGAGSRVLSGGGGAPSPPSPEEQKRRESLSKMNPSIAAVIDRLKNKGQPAANEAKFIRNGKAEIQIWLTDKYPETIAQIKQLGFEVVLEPKTATMVIGRLAIEKLAALVELKSVRYVAPMISN
jgi:hypothetical protein